MIPFRRRFLWSAAFIGGIRRLDKAFTVKPDDVYLASYPKSGNTWVRFLIGNLISQTPVGFDNIESIVPDSERNEDSKMLRIPSPRYIKTHSAFDPRFERVIHIVRDPREVAVSYFHFCKKNNNLLAGETIIEFTERFVRGNVGLDRYGSWGENTGSWLGARLNTPNFYVIRYEDLKSNAQEELETLSSSLGLNRTTEQIQLAIQNSSFDSMKKLEKKQGDQWVTTRNSNQSIPFVRSGNTDSWQKELPEESQKVITSTWKDTMQQLKYL